MTDLSRFMSRQGRQIKVETVPSKTPLTKARQHEDKAFIKVPLKWMAGITEAAKMPQAFVLVALIHMAWRAKSLTFPLTNDLLNRCGVSREAKRLALANYEATGFIVVERRGKQAPMITLVGLTLADIGVKT